MFLFIPYLYMETRQGHTLTSSQGTQKIQHMLFIDLVEPIALPDYLIRFRRHILLSVPEPGMGLNCSKQILCPPVVQEKIRFPRPASVSGTPPWTDATSSKASTSST